MNKYLPISIVAILITAGGLWYLKQSSSSVISETAQLPTVQEYENTGNKGSRSQSTAPTSVQDADKSGYVMDVSQSGGHTLVTNRVLGVQFSVPDSFGHVGSNNFGAIGGGHFQIFNYQETEVSNVGRRSGKNKIEMFLIDDPTAFAAGEKLISVKIAGQDAFRAEAELKNFISYIVPLRTTPGKFITLTIYGDSDNYDILETVVASLSVE
jgi:hypothetical protein